MWVHRYVQTLCDMFFPYRASATPTSSSSKTTQQPKHILMHTLKKNISVGAEGAEQIHQAQKRNSNMHRLHCNALCLLAELLASGFHLRIQCGEQTPRQRPA